MSSTQEPFGRVEPIGLDQRRRSAAPTAPPDQAWAEIAPIRHRDLPAKVGVDVVVPVYRGHDDTLACLYAALTAASEVAFELTVVNDSTPEPALADQLRALAALGLFRLIENEVNKGFVASANLGLFLHPDRDVVLLNADTVVHDGWLDRLAWHAVQPGVGTVTPLSNNATINSYPRTLENNAHDLEVTHAELDAICAAANHRRSVEVPTGVGFCFYVRRALLDRIGGFDEVAFGRGYGEENDFCLRGANAGFRNLAALDVYVRHTGEVSFSDSAAAHRALGLGNLLALHPEYQTLVEAFIRADPLRPGREAIDIARVARLNAGRGVTFVDHGWLGGILRHLNELTGALAEEGGAVTRLYPTDGGARLTLTTLSPLDLPNLPSVPADDPAAIAGLLRSLGLAFVHIHSMVLHRLENFAHLIEGIGRAGLPYHLTIHDHTPVCPRVNMVDWGGSYCASPSTAHCRLCIAKIGTDFGPIDIDQWRAAHARIVEGAETVMVPDADLEARLRRYVDIRPPVRIRPHQVWVPAEPVAAEPKPPSRGGWTIGVIGAIGPHKGSGVLLAMAGDITRRKLPLRLRLYGYSDRDELPRFDCADDTGRYQEADLAGLIAANPCDFAFLASVCPETWSYALDTALEQGLHPVCFDLGASARRLERLGVGTVLPLRLIYDIQALNDALLRIEPKLVSLKPLGQAAWWGSRDLYYNDPAPPEAWTP